MKVNRYFLDTLVTALVAAMFFFGGLAAQSRFGPLTAFLAPAPLLWLTARHGAAAGTAAALLGSAALLPLLPSPAPAFSFLAGNALPGVLAGRLLAAGRPLVQTCLVATLAAVVLSITVSAAQFWFAGADALVFLQYQYGDILREVHVSIEAMTGGMTGPRRAETAALITFLSRTLPSVLFVTIYIQFSLNALLVVLIPLPGGPLPVVRPSFSAFAMPEQGIWLVIPSLALLLFAPLPYRTVALNVTLLLLFLYLLQGLSIAVHFMNRLKVSRPLRMVFLIAALLQPYILLLPLIAGLLDFRFDFRRPRPTPDG